MARTLPAAGLIAVLLAGLASPACAQGNVDPRLVGTWELPLQADTWVLRIEAAGTYSFTIESAVTQPGHNGTFKAASGQWRMHSSAGTPWTDGGTYSFNDADSVSMTGNLGTAIWKRRKAAGQSPEAGPVEKPGGLVSKLAPLVADARTQAQAWQPDASLIGIFVKCGPDGKVDLAHLAGLQNPGGGFISLQFISRTSGQTRAYGVDAGGRVSPTGPAMVPGTETAAIPVKFLDLDAALAKARELGLLLPRAGGAGFIDARLVGVHAGQVAATWTITSVEMRGAFAAPLGDPVVLNAASGEQTTEEVLSGRLERRMLAEELGRGTKFPATERDYEFYRKQAYLLAERWNKELRPLGVEVSGQLSGGRFALSHAAFAYFLPVEDPPGDSQLTIVIVSPSDGSMLVRVDQFDKAMTARELHPREVPGEVLAPAIAAAKLRDLDPKLKVDPVGLQLVFGGVVAESALRQDVKLPSDVLAAIKDRWLWLSRTEHTVTEHEGIFAWNRTASESLAIDAVTGEPVLRDGALAGGRPETRSAIPDPALLGLWTGTIPEVSAGISLDVAPSGACKMGVRSPQLNRNLTGTIQAAGGNWAVKDSAGGEHRGTYRFPDPDTLEWTDATDGKPVTLKRAAGRARPEPPIPGRRQVDGPDPKPITMDDLDTVPKLIALLKDEDSVTRQNAAIALGNIGSAAKDAVPVLASIVLDRDRRVAEAASKALGQIGAAPGTSVPALARVLATQWLAPVVDEGSGVRSAAAFSLGQFGEAAAPAAEALGAALSDPAPGVFMAAAEALAKIGPKAAPATPALAAALRSRNENLRGAAAKTLEMIGPAAKDAVPALVAALRDRYLNVAGSAAQALGAMGNEARAAVPALIDALDSQGLAIDAGAALCRIPEAAPTAVPAVASMLERTAKDLFFSYGRGKVIKALGDLGAPARPAVPALVKILRSDAEHDDNRKAAGLALEQLGPAASDAVSSLAEHMKDKSANAASRSCAARVLGAIGPSASSALPALSAVLNDSSDKDDVRFDAREAKKRIEGR